MRFKKFESVDNFVNKHVILRNNALFNYYRVASGGGTYIFECRPRECIDFLNFVFPWTL